MKFKKALKRMAAPVLCVVLLCCTFALPVSAASSGWSGFSTNLMTLMGSETAALFYNDTYYLSVNPYEWYGTAGVSYHMPGTFPSGKWTLRIPINNIDIHLQAGDLFQFNALYEGTIFEGLGSNPSVRLAFIDEVDDNGTLFNEVKFSYEFTPRWNGTMGRYTHDVRVSWTATSDCEINSLYAFVDVTNRVEDGSGTGGRTRFYLKQISIGYGNSSSPEAPSYSAPEGGEKVDELDKVEGELQDNTADGQAEVEEILSQQSLADTLLSYAKGLQFTSQIMLSAIMRIPFLNALIWVAMSLGFVATLLGLMGAIVTASDRRASREARQSKGRGK